MCVAYCLSSRATFIARAVCGRFQTSASPEAGKLAATQGICCRCEPSRMAVVAVPLWQSMVSFKSAGMPLYFEIFALNVHRLLHVSGSPSTFKEAGFAHRKIASCCRVHRGFHSSTCLPVCLPRIVCCVFAALIARAVRFRFQQSRCLQAKRTS